MTEESGPEEDPETPGAAEVPEGDPTAEPVPVESRRYPSTLGGAFYILILLTTLGAMLVVVFADWRTGVRILAGALGAAGVLRLILPDRDAGMLAVRPRPVDVALLVGVGAVLWWLAGSIPDPPPV